MPTNILTVDVEDWFHICGAEQWLPQSDWDRLESRVRPNLERLLLLLERAGSRATFFFLGLVVERDPELVSLVGNAGHEVACHGQRHELVYRQSPADFAQDLRTALVAIKSVWPRDVLSYRAPQWSLGRLPGGPPRRGDDGQATGGMEWAFETLVQLGFRHDSSLAPVRWLGHPRGLRQPHVIGTRFGELLEYPPLVLSTLLGNIPVGLSWGLRRLPLSVIRRAVFSANRQEIPAVVAIHPGDIDPSLPRVALPLTRRFAVGGDGRRTEERLRRLLDEFEFTSLAEASRLRPLRDHRRL